MHHRPIEMCEAAAHELRAEFDLAAVIIWVADQDRQHLRLAASVGIQRRENGLPTIIRSSGGSSCLAELAVNSNSVVELDDVRNHILSAMSEGVLCFVQPGAVSVHPMVLSGTVLGVAEFIARDGDPDYKHYQNLLPVIVEHLTLAANSAIMFELVERLASHDPLTGLANHRLLQDFLYARLEEAKRHKNSLAVAMIDVDHFRQFNEEEGHDAGDAVLKLVADTLASCSRQYDLVARYGGEEFTVVMPGTDSESMLAVAERMRESVSEIPYFNTDGVRRRITISVGCAVFPSDAADTSAILKAADTALYRAKRNGRNRVEAASSVLDSIDENTLEPTIVKEVLTGFALQMHLVNAEQRKLATIFHDLQEGAERPHHNRRLVRIAEAARSLIRAFRGTRPDSAELQQQIQRIVATLESAA